MFLDNHDLQRSPPNESKTISFNTPRRLQTATAFMLAHNYGIPSIMSSYRFNSSGEGPPVRSGSSEICSPYDRDCHGWMLEHRFRSIVEMLKFRKAVGNTPVRSWQNVGENQIAFCRGGRGFFAVNNNALQDFDTDMLVCLTKGEYCDAMSIDENGQCLNIISVNEKRFARIRIATTKEIPAVVIYRTK